MDRWELVAGGSLHDRTERLEVPGGWIYRVLVSAGEAPALCFVPLRESESRRRGR